MDLCITDASHKITSIRDATGFGDIEKEFGCGEYQEAVKNCYTRRTKKNAKLNLDYGLQLFALQK